MTKELRNTLAHMTTSPVVIWSLLGDDDIWEAALDVAIKQVSREISQIGWMEWNTVPFFAVL